MPTPALFVGKPLAFLKTTYPDYREAVKNEASKEEALKIVRRFNKRFSPLKDLSNEPSDEFINSVDDDEPDEGYEKPDPKTMSEEEYKKKLRVYKDRMKAAQTRKEVCACYSSRYFADWALPHSKSCDG
jgi:stress response protein YsnF